MHRDSLRLVLVAVADELSKLGKQNDLLNDACRIDREMTDNLRIWQNIFTICFFLNLKKRFCDEMRIKNGEK